MARDTVEDMGESWASNPGTAKSMRSNRGRDTGLELRVRRELHRRGLRYRVDIAPIPGLRSRADVVFTRMRIAVYLDGCFWHACPIHGAHPIRNSEYWQAKLARNQERDTQATKVLQAAGWVVLRFWEHEENTAVVDAIQVAVASVRRSASFDPASYRTSESRAMGHLHAVIGERRRE